ncbi:MAG: ABC transporter ATP-binding protein [Dethiobacter sp.]|jgi:branched-chain amino acid transport system ATP-binding protein|nr:MAG: ABC transporter ATP-binding protein [Dethiobacter sp.]
MLEIKNIDVYYGDLQALWDVSVNIAKGEIVTLIGSNGAGKSTLLKTISGLLKPRKGSILFEEVELDKLPAYKTVELGIAMVPEGRKIFTEMSVHENLELGAFTREARKEKNKTAEWVYEIFPILKERTRQKAGTLSGGEQQMLAIGRGLMSLPKLLIIDEMSLGLAPVIVQEIAAILKKINKTKGTSIFLVEQNVQMVLALADRGYIIENGRIVREGKTDALLNSESVRNAYLGI